MNTSVFTQALQSAEAIFINPSVLYEYEEIIHGTIVNGVRKKAVDNKHYASIWQKLTYGDFFDDKVKAMKVCDEVFLSKKDRVLNKLSSKIKTREEMNAFEDEFFISLKEALLAYSNPILINESYNRI